MKAKIEGGEVRRTATSTKSSGEVVDLLAALQRSVDAAKTARGESGAEAGEAGGEEKPAKKPAAKKTAAKKSTAKKAPAKKAPAKKIDQEVDDEEARGQEGQLSDRPLGLSSE